MLIWFSLQTSSITLPNVERIRAQRCDVGRHAQHVHRIEIDIGNGFGERHEWVAGVKFRAQQALLFRRGGDKKHRAFWFDFEIAEGARDAKHAPRCQWRCLSRRYKCYRPAGRGVCPDDPSAPNKLRIHLSAFGLHRERWRRHWVP